MESVKTGVIVVALPVGYSKDYFVYVIEDESRPADFKVKGQRSMIMGTSEPGETPEETALREVPEEVPGCLVLEMERVGIFEFINLEGTLVRLVVFMALVDFLPGTVARIGHANHLRQTRTRERFPRLTRHRPYPDVEDFRIGSVPAWDMVKCHLRTRQRVAGG